MNEWNAVDNNRQSFNLYTVLKDILFDWVVIVLITISVGMMSFVGLSYLYKPSYTTSATMVVTNSGVNNNAYSNLRAASTTAENFSHLVNSSTMRRIVARDMGLDDFKGTAAAKYLEGSNLITITVKADTPGLSFRQMNAILENYPEVAKDFLGNINITLISSPTVPRLPDIPFRPAKWIALSMAIAFLVTIIFLGVLSTRRDTIRESDDVEDKLDTKLLGTIPYEEKNKGIRKKIRTRKQKESILITNPVVSFEYVEAIRKLASRVLVRMEERKGKVILLTSLLENEGKSTVAANLALALSEEGKKILLIDTDFRNPALYKMLNMREEEFTGLAGALSAAESAAEIEGIELNVPGTKLNVMLNKTAISKSLEKISHAVLRELIDRYKSKMDYIIIDSPPMGLVADAEEIATYSDGCILVVRQHMADSRDLNDALDALNGGHHRMLGCVFNNVHTRLMDLPGSVYTYNGGYRYGYKTGYGGDHSE